MKEYTKTVTITPFNETVCLQVGEHNEYNGCAFCQCDRYGDNWHCGLYPDDDYLDDVLLENNDKEIFRNDTCKAENN